MSPVQRKRLQLVVGELLAAVTALSMYSDKDQHYEDVVTDVLNVKRAIQADEASDGIDILCDRIEHRIVDNTTYAAQRVRGQIRAVRSMLT